MKTQKRVEARRRVRVRIQQKVRGSGERPRLAVFKSGRHIYAQLIDDVNGVTLVSASSIEKPWSSDAVRQGASPTAQSTSATTPHDRHTTWW